MPLICSGFYRFPAQPFFIQNICRMELFRYPPAFSPRGATEETFLGENEMTKHRDILNFAAAGVPVSEIRATIAFKRFIARFGSECGRSPATGSVGHGIHRLVISLPAIRRARRKKKSFFPRHSPLFIINRLKQATAINPD